MPALAANDSSGPGTSGIGRSVQHGLQRGLRGRDRWFRNRGDVATCGSGSATGPPPARRPPRPHHHHDHDGSTTGSTRDRRRATPWRRTRSWPRSTAQLPTPRRPPTPRPPRTRHRHHDDRDPRRPSPDDRQHDNRDHDGGRGHPGRQGLPDLHRRPAWPRTRPRRSASWTSGPATTSLPAHRRRRPPRRDTTTTARPRRPAGHRDDDHRDDRDPGGHPEDQLTTWIATEPGADVPGDKRRSARGWLTAPCRRRSAQRGAGSPTPNPRATAPARSCAKTSHRAGRPVYSSRKPENNRLSRCPGHGEIGSAATTIVAVCQGCSWSVRASARSPLPRASTS